MREIESFLFLLKDVKRTSCNGVFQVVSAIIGGVLYTLLQETSVVLFLKWMYGYGNMNRPVQSVSLFRNCPYVLSVGQAIGLLIFFVWDCPC